LTGQEITRTGNAMPQETPASDCRPSEDKRRARSRLPAGAEVRRQGLAVVSFLADKWHGQHDVPQFLFRVYACFEHEDEANTWVRNVCGDHVKDHDIFVVNTSEWLFPQKVKSGDVKHEVYRSDELNCIMKSHSEQPAKVQQFEEWNKAEAAKEVSATDALPPAADEATPSDGALALPPAADEATPSDGILALPQAADEATPSDGILALPPTAPTTAQDDGKERGDSTDHAHELQPRRGADPA